MTEEEKAKQKIAVKNATDAIYAVVKAAFEKYYTDEVRRMMLLSIIVGGGDELMKAGMLDSFANGALAILTEAIDYNMLKNMKSDSDSVQ